MVRMEKQLAMVFATLEMIDGMAQEE